MRLQELFLIETTEEDRAIVSLSSSIFDYLRKYENKPGKINVGKISDIFNTPLEIFNDVQLILMPEDELRQEHGSADDVGSFFGFWDPELKTIFLNSEYLSSNRLKGTISHELRHALDDFKSDFKANRSDRYFTPKKKPRSMGSLDLGNASFLAQPAEINARFLEVMHALTYAIRRAFKLPPDQIRPSINAALKRSMELNRIAELFPEREKSKDYKRLMKRATDYIEKELAYLKNTQRIQN